MFLNSFIIWNKGTVKKLNKIKLKKGFSDFAAYLYMNIYFNGGYGGEGQNSSYRKNFSFSVRHAIGSDRRAVAGRKTLPYAHRLSARQGQDNSLQGVPQA